MGGEGSMMAMIKSLRNNRKLLRKNSRFKKGRSFLNLKETDLKGATGKPTFNAYSKEAIKKIKSKFGRRRKREKVFLIFLGLIGLFLFVSLGKFLVEDVLQEHNDSRLELIQNKERLYLKHIEFGDRWFSQGKWKNAIFYYKQGVELYPEDYEINYRVVRAYILKCKDDLENCAEAKALLDDMLLKFLDKETQLLELKEVLNFEYGI